MVLQIELSYIGQERAKATVTAQAGQVACSHRTLVRDVQAHHLGVAWLTEYVVCGFRVCVQSV